MTWKQKLAENEKLISLYDAFLPECKDYTWRLKLICEIARLQKQVIQINAMSVSDFLSEAHDHKIELNG